MGGKTPHWRILGIKNDPIFRANFYIKNLLLIVLIFDDKIHCDRDYNKIVKVKETINNNFLPFEVKFSEIGLFEIYPAKRL